MTSPNDDGRRVGRARPLTAVALGLCVAAAIAAAMTGVESRRVSPAAISDGQVGKPAVPGAVPAQRPPHSEVRPATIDDPLDPQRELVNLG
jgi:hypothetical protein